MKLAVLCPSRGRPAQARRLQDSLEGIAPVFFYLDDDDPMLEEYDVTNKLVAPTTTYTFALNILWQRLPGFDAYGLFADDGLCRSPNLVRSLEARSGAFPDGIWVAGAYDGIEKGSFPLPIVSKRWTEILGFACNPIFLHWYGDSSATRLAQDIGRFIDLSDEVELAHIHPKTGKAKPDETFHRIRSPLRKERDHFVSKIERYYQADRALLMEALEH